MDPSGFGSLSIMRRRRKYRRFRQVTLSSGGVIVLIEWDVKCSEEKRTWETNKSITKIKPQES
jgi:hypothetical protein